MTKRELIDLCLTFTGSYEDYPFDETTALVRHSLNKKMFALIDDSRGVYINLKCEPMQAGEFRRQFEGCTPGYHMNKTHWNTVLANSDVPYDLLMSMIAHSYDLTKPKPQKQG